MGRKIFISYKYADKAVCPLPSNYYFATTARDYVDIIQNELAKEDHINLGEKDGEDLSNFKDSTIESKLRDKIFSSSITIVLISKNMKDFFIPEDDQWIPWEISYSLQEKTREDRTSRTNAVLGVVIPDQNNSYSYFINNHNCCNSGCRILLTSSLFKILRLNMFNQKKKTSISSQCPNVYVGNSSYISVVQWNDFKSKVNEYIKIACDINEHIEDYDITKIV